MHIAVAKQLSFLSYRVSILSVLYEQYYFTKYFNVCRMCTRWSDWSGSSPGRFAPTERSHGTLQVRGLVSLVAYLDAAAGEKYLL
jgi:hypothetical protein